MNANHMYLDVYWGIGSHLLKKKKKWAVFS